MTRIDVPPASARRRSSRLPGILILLLLVAVAAAALWAWLTLSWAYADGERAGVLQKFVNRGWICKTREGELALYYGGGQYMGPGSSQQLWDFSVRDPAIAAQLAQAVGHRVQLHYTEHPGVPTQCFADTRYFVDKVTVSDAPGGGSASAPATAPSGQGVPDARPGATVLPPPPATASP